MATTKNALIRYYHLDRLLSDEHHLYDRKTLTEKVNDLLDGDGYKTVGKRTIEKDIDNLKGAPFNAPIKEDKRANGKTYVYYRDPSFSLFSHELSEEERHLLHEVLATLGQFDGLDNFKWLERLRFKLGLEERKQIICFSNNQYYESSSLLGMLFDQISNKVVIRLSYHTLAVTAVRDIVFHPYLLKQYNDRWFLLGAADDDKAILNFPLDRIDDVEPLPESKYVECPEDLEEHFEDIVGVSLPKEGKVEEILCWVSDASKGYVDTKPIHGSYTPIKGEKDQQLRAEYPQLDGGMFFTLECINNYELIRELCSYGKELLVLRSDGSVKDDVMKRIREMNDTYSELR